MSLTFCLISPSVANSAYTIYEAEEAELTNSIVQTEHSGFTGGGYVNFSLASGASLTWSNVYAPSNGMYDLTIRYALGEPDRSVDIYINGTLSHSNVNFPYSGGWTRWNAINISYALNSGLNTVQIITSGYDGPNVDHLQGPQLSGGGSPGDADGNGGVDENDYSIWIANYDKNLSGLEFADFNEDSKVDGIDFIVWQNNYNNSSPSVTATLTPSTTPVSVTATPTPGDGTTIWWGDAATNGFDAWDGIQCPTGNATIENDPEGRYGKVYKSHLGSGDTYGGRSRCEYWGTILPSGAKFNYHSGDDYYFGWRTRISDGMHTTGGNSGNFIQLKGNSSCGGPAIGLTMYGGKLTLRTELYGVFWYGPDVSSFSGSWHDFILHVHFSKDASAGFVEAWLDGSQLIFKDGSSRYYVSTMCPNDDYVYLKMGYYRGSNIDFPAGTHWFQSPRAGPSYSSVVPR